MLYCAAVTVSLSFNDVLWGDNRAWFGRIIWQGFHAQQV